jgi:phosphoribosylformimino-5-aminoimidazole carboxamide ribotide isomerase
VNKLTVIPAIDLKGGRCVRLRQGRAADETVYAEDPVQMALRWQDQGAERLHVVDLDGAFQGQPVHTAAILAIVRAVRIPVQTGGGLRTDAHIQALLDGGIARVVLGTRACQAPTDLERWVQRFGEKLAVGLDARNGRVTIKGWTETTNLDALVLAQSLERLGVRTLIYTDIAQDGMLTGPNVKAVRALCEKVRCAIIASGGVASAAHVAALARLGQPNLQGVIVGKALYEGTVTLAELQAGCNESNEFGNCSGESPLC